MGKTVQDLVVSLSQELAHRTVNSFSELRNMVIMFDPRTKKEAASEMWDKLPEFVNQFWNEDVELRRT